MTSHSFDLSDMSTEKMFSYHGLKSCDNEVIEKMVAKTATENTVFDALAGGRKKQAHRPTGKPVGRQRGSKHAGGRPRLSSPAAQPHHRVDNNGGMNAELPHPVAPARDEIIAQMHDHTEVRDLLP